MSEDCVELDTEETFSFGLWQNVVVTISFFPEKGLSDGSHDEALSILTDKGQVHWMTFPSFHVVCVKAAVILKGAVAISLKTERTLEYVQKENCGLGFGFSS